MSLSRSKSNIPTVIGTPVNYPSDISDDEKSMSDQKEKLEREVDNFLSKDKDLEDFKYEEYISDEEDNYIENKARDDETICNNNLSCTVPERIVSNFNVLSIRIVRLGFF